jgi:hypothetical protein
MAQATTLFVQAPTTVINANGNSGILPVNAIRELAVDINITAVSGTSPTLQFFVDRVDANNIPNPIWQSSLFTGVTQERTSIGPGLTYPESLGANIKVRWVVGGSSPSFTLSSSFVGK